MKTCTKCKTEKPETEFSKNSRARDGLQYHCKACRKAIDAAWRADNPARILEYRVENRDRDNAQGAAYRSANPGKVKDAKSNWRDANTEKIKEYTASWAKANPGAIRIKNHSRRARERESGGRLSTGLMGRLFKLQKGKCACCGKPLGNKYHLDHIMPLKLGGSNTDDNMQLLTATCNLQKNAKHPIDFMQSRGFLI